MKGNIRYGGQLQLGDFIVVSNDKTLTFGWYTGLGNNTVQYVSITTPISMNRIFENWKSNPTSYRYYDKKFEKKGLLFSHLPKGYVLDKHRFQIAKIPGNPEDLFTNVQDLENYRASKKVLESMKFPAR